MLLHTEVTYSAILAFSPRGRTERFIGDDKSDFDPLSFSATSTFALHAVALNICNTEPGNSIDAALAPPSPELGAALFQR